MFWLDMQNLPTEGLSCLDCTKLKFLEIILKILVEWPQNSSVLSVISNFAYCLIVTIILRETAFSTQKLFYIVVDGTFK